MLTPWEVREIRKRAYLGESLESLRDEYGFAEIGSVQAIVHGLTYAHVGGPRLAVPAMAILQRSKRRKGYVAKFQGGP